jgi:phage tail sheath gpL-like
VQLGATLAIGDQWNDLEMLAEVGHGAAMPSAPDAVQAVARYIAPPLAEEGVARMIEALVLARPAIARAAARRLAEEADALRAGMETLREAADTTERVASEVTALDGSLRQRAGSRSS